MAEGWTKFSAINKTANSTGKMGTGDVAGAAPGEQVNKKNPYGAGPHSDNTQKGGKKSSSHENY